MDIQTHRDTRSTTMPSRIEIHLEELGEHSWRRALLATLSGSYGSAFYRFVARAEGSPAPRSRAHPEADHVAMSATFPAMRLSNLDDTTDRNGWIELAREQLRALDADLVAAGWHRRSDAGRHWWSLHYDRET